MSCAHEVGIVETLPGSRVEIGCVRCNCLFSKKLAKRVTRGTPGLFEHLVHVKQQRNVAYTRKERTLSGTPTRSKNGLPFAYA